MKTIQAIIDLFGGLPHLRNNPIKLEVHGFMPLSTEFIGPGPRGLPLISVMHYYEQHGDVMRDPDMEFEIDEHGELHPISYRQDSIALMQVSIFIDSETGEVKVKPRLVRELKRFARQWSNNLAEQEFIDAARSFDRNDDSQE